MARLKVAVEAAYQSGYTRWFTSSVYGWYTTVPPKVHLSVYVTDMDHEPVVGLQPSDFEVKYLTVFRADPPPVRGIGSDTYSDPGLYLIELDPHWNAVGTTYGVRVNKPTGPSGAQQAYDSGFGMATVIMLFRDWTGRISL